MISVAHSPDSDDIFMFWAIAQNIIDTQGLTFTFTDLDTASLNAEALAGTYDVTAISTAIYPQIRDTHYILPHGASVGRNYGPVVVAKSDLSIENLSTSKVGVPGMSTTAVKVLQLLSSPCDLIEYSIEPYEAAFSLLENNTVDALLLIHEGQIAYKQRGYKLIADLGKWWSKETSLPLPLGVNTIKKSLGQETITKASSVIQNSIRYSIENRKHLLANLESHTDVDLDKYLSMYANNDTLSMRDDVTTAIRKLLPELPPEALLYPPTPQ